MSQEVDRGDTTDEIAAKYELMIEDVRERVQQINERIKPLTAEFDIPPSIDETA
jgi:hypothetical protein